MRFIDWLGRFRRLMYRDDLRTPAQTAGAVLLAYAAMRMVAPSNVSWGVFSALFVVQATIGGTVGTALQRMGGAVLGAVVAVICVAVCGTGGWRTVLALFIGVLSMSLITARRPSMSYGLVTVAVIIVSPDFYVLKGALAKVAAIVIGSLCGMAASFALFPMSAHRNANRHLSDALRLCGDYVADCLGCMTDSQRRRQRDIEGRVGTALENARSMWQQAWTEKLPRVQDSLISNGTLRDVERCRRSLTLLERFGDKPLPDEVCRRLQAAMSELADSMRRQLHGMADAVAGRKECGSADEMWAAYKSFSRDADAALADADVSQETRERVVAVKWACHSAVLSIASLTERLRRRAGAPPQSA